ncbi:uncharacterized protein M6B38_393215 [Iris pallida]|uniref:Uncharacterized protein n=1 Tax=Iris pallida TaxID=29817 RepID=A0AAX6FXZ0_IRIPA|nr:uncharacterized protein M6B38_393215 [Iris pallida]
MVLVLSAMHLTRLATDVFGWVTISLVSLIAVVGLLCIYLSVYFQIRIQRRGSLQLGFFNGPWIIRIALILVSVWWGFGEIARLTFINDKRRLFTNSRWQMDICKFYILSNLGFTEPIMFLILAFLLQAALQRKDAGTLSQRWNKKTFGYTILCCLPIFILQVCLIFFGHEIKMAKIFTRTSSSIKGNKICTYPLLSTASLFAFDAFLITYVSCIGSRMLSLVINKGLRRRVYALIFSVIFFLPLRALLLALSALPEPGNLLYEATVFLAFLMLLFSSMVGICMLVYYPVADSLALRDLGRIELEGVPYDDYYSDGASLIANQSYQGETTGNTSEGSTKRSSISFRVLIKEEPRAFDGIV